jgi:hypothetical protein
MLGDVPLDSEMPVVTVISGHTGLYMWHIFSKIRVGYGPRPISV